MNKIAILLFVILAGGVLYYFYQQGAIPTTLMSVSKLPKKRPENLVIEVSKQGGMLPISKGIYISKDSCYQKHRAYQTENKTYFTLNASELDQIYATFVNNKFDRLKTRNIRTHDRGGVSIFLRINRATYKIHDSGSTYINKGSKAAFSHILSSIKSLVANKLAPLKQAFEVKIDSSIAQVSQSGYLGSHTADISHGFQKNQPIPGSLSFRLLPGKHLLRINFTTRSALPNSKNYLSGDLKFTVTSDTKGVMVKMPAPKDSPSNRLLLLTY
ncbi:hypothetical protein [Microscilla marina]|uniref:Uncharacterized protein n=1 Tax=Microscilla marina ATCC 23134 TaxID=313606 RepID=A1ZU42_MICM2|nr:hypothetical protein [Microscilla marina]EAY26155.1 hypothetical protein M23134_06028 [Microscilla marina ATCC 23134]